MATRSGVKSYRLSFDFYVTPGVKLLLIANFAVFLLEAFIHYYRGVGGYESLLKWFGLVPAGVFPGLRIWQPFTYLFLHEVTDVWHIILNMLFLWMFGREVELVWAATVFCATTSSPALAPASSTLSSTMLHTFGAATIPTSLRSAPQEPYSAS
jgi:membrane associated rhomboid family serine protease